MGSYRPQAPQATDEEWKCDVGQLDRIIPQSRFWALVRLTRELAFCGEVVGRWAEGCPCHEHLLVTGKHITCQFKSCRAPELAVGAADGLMSSAFMKANSNAVAFVSGLPPNVQKDLMVDFDMARSRMESLVTLKLAYFQHLPHALCGLGHHSPEQAMLAARRCLQLWETGSRGSRHAMSRRFLDASWSGLPGEYEPPLRPFAP